MERATGRRKAVPNAGGEETGDGVSERLTHPTAPESSANQNYFERHTSMHALVSVHEAICMPMYKPNKRLQTCKQSLSIITCTIHLCIHQLKNTDTYALTIGTLVHCRQIAAEPKCSVFTLIQSE